MTIPTTTKLTFDAILFDMDGTLVDSTAGVEGAWAHFKETYHGIDIHQILQTSHGVRTVDNLRNFCGITDPDELESEALRFEQAIVNSAANGGGQGIVLLPGVTDIMKELGPHRSLPNPSWAICTSATRAYASQALKIAGVPVPDVFVTSEDVQKGKPFPDPYLLGAKNCGTDPARCLVVEDAPSGLRSGRAAGCKTLGLLTTHSLEKVKEAQPDYVVPNLASVTMRKTDAGIEVTISH